MFFRKKKESKWVIDVQNAEATHRYVVRRWSPNGYTNLYGKMIYHYEYMGSFKTFEEANQYVFEHFNMPFVYYDKREVK